MHLIIMAKFVSTEWNGLQKTYLELIIHGTFLALHTIIIVFCLQCDHTVALKSFFDMILNEPTKLAIVGGGCSVATEPVAEIAHYYNITQVG